MNDDTSISDGRFPAASSLTSMNRQKHTPASMRTITTRRHFASILRTAAYTVQAIELKDSNERPAIIYLPTTLTENPHFMRDLARYPAAVSAVLFAPQLLSLKYGRRISEERAYLDFTGDLLRWRDLFSYKGKSYSNLNKTLDSVQNSLLNDLIPNLPYVKLERAIIDQVALEFYLIAIDAFARDIDILKDETAPRLLPDNHSDICQQYLKSKFFSRIFQRASAAEYEEALDLYCRLTGRSSSYFSKSSQSTISYRFQLRIFFCYLADYRGREAGNLVSLVKRVTRWHRLDENIGLLTVDSGENPDGLPDPGISVATPQFNIPMTGLRFLSTVGEIIAESTVMRHCVKYYAERAVSGMSFLFHFELSGCHATIELNSQGRLVQVFGPRNVYNQACEYIERKLGNNEIW